MKISMGGRGCQRSWLAGRIVPATRRHRGERIPVTFGGGHKYWLLERLRERGDIELLDLRGFLPY